MNDKRRENSSDKQTTARHLVAVPGKLVVTTHRDTICLTTAMDRITSGPNELSWAIIWDYKYEIDVQAYMHIHELI